MLQDSFSVGILSDIEIQNLLDNKFIISSSKSIRDQVQPAG